MTFDFDSVIDRTNTFAVKHDLAALRGKPVDTIKLWVADMDFPTAPCIQNALSDFVSHGIFGYSRPDARYYDALRTWFKSRHDFLIDDSWVVNTPGVVFALNAAIRAFTEAGDGVLIQRPVYYPFFNTIEALGRRVVNSPLVIKDGRYGIDFDDFERKIESENVRLFILCSPHNPVGRVWTREELERISGICLSHGVLVVSDEIHSDITFGENHHTVYATLSPEAAANSITCTSPSKSFNLAGLQFSNIIIPDEKIRRLFRRAVDQTGYDEPGLMGIAAATAAYSQGGEWFDEAMKYIQANIRFTRDYLASRRPQITMREPEGTYLVWLDFSAFTGLTDRQISERILRGAKVWLDEGVMFGKEGEKFQRINVATPRAVLEDALGRICAAFE